MISPQGHPSWSYFSAHCVIRELDLSGLLHVSGVSGELQCGTFPMAFSVFLVVKPVLDL